jgi:hypothetical protein
MLASDVAAAMSSQLRFDAPLASEVLFILVI